MVSELLALHDSAPTTPGTCLRVYSTSCMTALQTSLTPAHMQAWQQIQPASDLGQDCSTYKWSQTQTEVCVYIQLPEHLRRHEVRPTAFVLAPAVPFSTIWESIEGFCMLSRWLWS